MSPPVLLTTRFFRALLVVSIIPFVWVPLSWELFPEVKGKPWAMLVMMFIGSQFHVGASFFFYTDREMRRFMLGEERSRFVWAVLAVLLGFPLAGYLLSFLPRSDLKMALASILLAVYSGWQVHHYARQNFGIMAFLARAERVPLASHESTAVRLTSYAGVAGILGLIPVTLDALSGLLLSSLWYASVVLMLSGWGVWLFGLARHGLSGSRRRHIAMAGTLSFFLPLYAFDAMFPAFMGFALAHGYQYLVFMSVVCRPQLGTWRPLLSMLACAALIGGLTLSVSPNMAIGITMAHFVLDAGVWKLSEPFPRKYMSARFPFLS